MFNWETLRKLTGSNLAQHVILVPIIGWLLVYQNTFANMIYHVFGLDSSVSLSWEILLFYLGLVLLGISATTFRIFGPKAVLGHNGLQGYSEDTEAILTRKEFARLCEEIGCDQPDEITVPGAGTGQVLDTTLDQWKRLNSENIRDVLAQHYRSENSSRFGLRVFSSFTFLVGAIFTLIPTVTTVAWSLGQLIALLR